MKINFLTGCALSALAGMALPTMAFAKDTAPADATPPAAQAPAPDAASQNNGIGDIVVTAQKREERLQNVPISVTALSGDQLTKRGMTSLKDLVFAAPAYTTSEFSGFSQTYLRGVGSDIIVADAEAGVATYQDGIYQPLLIASLGELLGVQRVEVLYGPQGTLYGRNAVGGAVDVITLNPTQAFQADAKATFGNYNRHDFSGYVSGGITDNLAVGIYGATMQRDTYLILPNPAPVGTPTHETGQALRARAVFTPGDGWKFIATAEYMHSDGLESAYSTEGQANGIGYAFGAPQPTNPLDYNGNSPTEFKASIHKYSLEIDKDLRWANVVSISSYQKASVYDANDADGTALPLLASGNQDPDLHNFSQEVRLQSAATSKITWIAGVYYYHSVGGFLPQHITVLDGLTGTPGENERIQNNAAQSTNSIAAFGQATIPIVSTLKLTLGGRWSQDKKKFYDASVITSLPPTLVDAEAVTYPSSYGTVLSDTTYPDQRHTWSDFTPKVTLDYKLGDALFYATFSQGFKAGTYLYASPGSPGPVAPEKLTDFEGGVKADFADHRVRVDASAFHYNYKNLQVTLVEQGADGAPVQSIENAAAAEIYGGDISLTVQPFQGFTVVGTAAYTHSKYTSFPDALYSIPVVGGVGNTQIGASATGHELERVPTWSSAISANYQKNFADDSGYYLNALWSYNGGFAWDASNLRRQPAYSVVNGAIGYTLPGGKFTFSVWATNLFNKIYVRNELPDAYGNLISYAPPRMFGGSFEYKFR